MVDTAKIQARIAARELLSLAEDDSPEFWQGIIDEARKHLPPEPPATSSTEAKLREAEGELKRAKEVLDPMMDAARRQFPQLFRSHQPTNAE